MAIHSSTLAWKIPWMEEPGRLQSMGSLRVGHDWATSLSLSCIREGSGNPFQSSCLENLRDGGAWWAAVYAVAQSQTRLKQLSSSRKCKAEVVQNYELTETVSTSLCNIRVQSTLLLTNNRITAGTTQHSRFVSKVLRLLSIGNLPNALLLPPNTFQTFS